MPVGLYIHIPFCRGKCPYCDFYSVLPSKGIIDRYADCICSHLKEHSDRRFDTVYFGGGSPSLTRAKNIARMIECANLYGNPEITVECNPSDCGESGFDFEKAASAGVNRISLGMQSAVDSERKTLGRRADAGDVLNAVKRAQSAGIDNISLDLMLGTPGQNSESLKRSVDFCFSSGAKHISAYILKIEEGTRFFRIKDKLSLPDDDETADLYLKCVELIEENGMKQYEISNFAFQGFESRHNLKYWHCEQYLGLGPAAHSFIDGRRFYYERNLEEYMKNPTAVPDGEGGSFEEYAMLALRLTEGLQNSKVKERFNFDIPAEIFENAKRFEQNGLIKICDDTISLTAKGFLVSNAVIGSLII
ncbi:MAG: radical SAM family heme chaperone HemW [Clostridia bacterium]|nr:radical SAM family heme chaperone HemW [Clostridia bacterium]